MPSTRKTIKEIVGSYRHKRYWLLHESMRCRVQHEFGDRGAIKERKNIQRKMVELRNANTKAL